MAEENVKFNSSSGYNTTDDYNELLGAALQLGVSKVFNGNTTAAQKRLDEARSRLTRVSDASQAADASLKAAQLSSQQEAAANKTANINAGVNTSAAGMLGSQTASSNSTDTASNMYSGLRSAQASTQADYLEKMAQADALKQQASNMEKSAGLSAFSGGLQGASTGAAMGATISDENAKEPEDGLDEDELLTSINKFVELYNELKQLKGEK